MDDNRNGLIWPLALIFLLTTCGAFIGLIMSSLPNSTFDKRVALLLLVAALASGFVLYVPRLWLNAKVPSLDDMSVRTTAIHTELLGAQGSPGRLADLSTSVEDLRKQMAALDTKLHADLGAVTAKLNAIEAKLPKIV